ncbi:hypothetical protein HRI_004899000 [Hibiscus trionum]|uniref:Endonuclease/exonuclease/phosphatase domain-containing protein n=1 Tax=Hibiscus trionum TaxID=183268 RepID=A0A9W7JGC9_HIBTR|nr:hypothetical protein HRI_004899000 [Hibiscus trionum]
MNLAILSWNVRGLGRPEKSRAVTTVVRKSKAQMVFLQETKLDAGKTRLYERLKGNKYGNLECVGVDGAAGGMAILWEPNFFNLDTKSSSSRYIALVGSLVQNRVQIGFINVYAPNDQHERKNFWLQLEGLIESLDVPVIVGGDFNAVKSVEEKWGATASSTSMGDFNSFIDRCNLMDLNMEDGIFTWFRGGTSLAASRIDRFLISPEIAAKFPNLRQKCLSRSVSDHNPVLLEDNKISREPQPFKWFSHWADDPNYVEMVKATIKRSCGGKVPGLLRNIKRATRIWDKQRRTNKTMSIPKLEKLIEEREKKLLSSNQNSVDWVEIRRLRSELWRRLGNEEREWL